MEDKELIEEIAETLLDYGLLPIKIEMQRAYNAIKLLEKRNSKANYLLVNSLSDIRQSMLRKRGKTIKATNLVFNDIVHELGYKTLYISVKVGVGETIIRKWLNHDVEMKFSTLQIVAEKLGYTISIQSKNEQ